MRPKPKLGQYEYAPHYSGWGVWVVDSVTETGYSSSHVRDFKTKEEARNFVYEMNGWKNK